LVEQLPGDVLTDAENRKVKLTGDCEDIGGNVPLMT
jgi:hypothetical protein